jgi:hypothetical protein
VARFLFIVARQLPGVYEHLRQQFNREPNVEVIFDRRKGDRREADADGYAGADRRQGDRRRNATADEQLRVMGYAFVRIPD